MAQHLVVKVVSMDDAEQGLPLSYRPFAVVEDDEEGPCVVCWVWEEKLDPKDSRIEGNQPNWEPPSEDMEDDE